MATCRPVVLLLVALSLCSQHGAYAGGRVLFAGAPMFSHLNEYAGIAAELIQRGYEVHFALAETFPAQKLVSGTGIKVLTFKSPPENVPQFFGKEFDDFLMDSVFNKMSLRTLGAGLATRSLDYCDAMLSDDVFAKQVQDKNFDLVVVDELLFMRCLVLLPKKLNLPFVTEVPYPETLLAGAPFWPVAAPSEIAHQTAEDLMCFTGRLQVFLYQIVMDSMDFPKDATWLIEKHFPGSNLRFRDIVRGSLFWFYGTMDPSLDFPRVTMPNSAFVGGLTTTPAKPLARDLETFVAGAQHGVIVLSFGSLAKNIPTATLQKFVDAFSRLKQRVVMRVNDISEINASDNVRLQTWLPQNDLLGHNNTKLFVTHCGANGVYEAVYHGVPMLGVPIIPNDQPYVAKKIASKGFGLWLDLHSLTSEDVYQAVTTILDDAKYSKNVKKASTIFKSMPMTPRETAAFWIDHVINYGGEHLRPLSLDMPVWSYLMLDIYAFLLACLLTAVGFIYFFVKFICGRICGRPNKKEDPIKKKM